MKPNKPIKPHAGRGRNDESTGNEASQAAGQRRRKQQIRRAKTVKQKKRKHQREIENDQTIPHLKKKRKMSND